MLLLAATRSPIHYDARPTKNEPPNLLFYLACFRKAIGRASIILPLLQSEGLGERSKAKAANERYSLQHFLAADTL